MQIYRMQRRIIFIQGTNKSRHLVGPSLLARKCKSKKKRNNRREALKSWGGESSCARPRFFKTLPPSKASLPLKGSPAFNRYYFVFILISGTPRREKTRNWILSTWENETLFTPRSPALCVESHPNHWTTPLHLHAKTGKTISPPFFFPPLSPIQREGTL